MIAAPRHDQDIGVGDLYYRDAGATKLLGAEQEQELAIRIGKGDIEARDHFVRANLRFVVTIARRFCGRGVSLEDLIQEGNLGLVHAVEEFDPARHLRFATFARYWIQQSIQRAMEQARTTIRLPGYALDLVGKWRRAVTELQEKLGRPPTEEEIASEVDLSPRQLRTIKKALRIYNQPGHGSFDSVLQAGGDGQHQGNPGSPLEQSDELGHMLQLINKLDERDAVVLRMRFGLDGQDTRTLEQIGECLGLSRERVRQVERQALARLRTWLDELEE